MNIKPLYQPFSIRPIKT